MVSTTNIRLAETKVCKQSGNADVARNDLQNLIYPNKRGFEKELQKCLKTKRVVRKSRTTSLKGKGLGRIVDAISISERPAEVEDRAIPGHWEGDLIQGCNNTFIATLVKRHSRYVMLAKVSDNKTATVITALIKQARKLPTELYKTMT